MTATPSSLVASRTLLRRIFRVGFPQVVIVLALFLCIATRIRAGHDNERQWFNLFRMVVVVVAGALLGIWAFFLSGWRKLPVTIVLVVLIGGGLGLFRIEYDGDLRASIHLRQWLLRLFNATHDDDVEEHRKQQAASLQRRPIDLTPQPFDSPGYRGADRTGVVDEPAIARDWNARPPRLLWKQPTFGGYSAFAVVNGFLFTMEQRRDDEAVVCYDGQNGNELWVHKWPGKFEEAMGGAGPRSTPTVDAGEVFALGATGRLVCLDGVTGNLKWAVETLEGNKNLKWAMSGSPLVYGNLVVVNPGTQSAKSAGRALIAFDRRNGQTVWSIGSSQAGYSSPMIASLAGRPQLLLFDGAGLAGFEPDTGKELWRHPWKTNGGEGINVAQPMVIEKEIKPALALGVVAGSSVMQPLFENKGEVFIASGYGRGGALLKVEETGGKWSVEEIWTTGRTAMRCKFANPVVYNGYLYGLDDGDLQCIDLKDGRKMWTDRREPDEGEGVGHGQILLSGDRLVVLSQFGEVVLVEARPDRFNEVGRLKVLKGNKTWNNPALSGGLLYIRNHVEMACVDLR